MHASMKTSPRPSSAQPSTLPANAGCGSTAFSTWTSAESLPSTSNATIRSGGCHVMESPTWSTSDSGTLPRLLAGCRRQAARGSGIQCRTTASGLLLLDAQAVRSRRHPTRSRTGIRLELTRLRAEWPPSRQGWPLTPTGKWPLFEGREAVTRRCAGRKSRGRPFQVLREHIRCAEDLLLFDE